MNLKLENEKLTIVNDEKVNAESISIYDINIDFSEEWNEFTNKEIIFTNGEHTYEREIIDDTALFPSIPNGKYFIGIVGLIIENNEIVKRKATNLVPKTVMNSSAEYETNTEDEEAELSLIQKKIAEIEDDLDVYNKEEINTMLENYLQFEVVEEIE